MRCTKIPVRGDRINIVCDQCGHINTLHIGCECCPICELLELLERIER